MPLRWPRLTAIAQFACRAWVNGMPYLVHVLYLHVIRAWLPATWSAHLLTVFREGSVTGWVYRLSSSVTGGCISWAPSGSTISMAPTASHSTTCHDIFILPTGLSRGDWCMNNTARIASCTGERSYLNMLWQILSNWTFDKVQTVSREIQPMGRYPVACNVFSGTYRKVETYSVVAYSLVPDL